MNNSGLKLVANRFVRVRLRTAHWTKINGKVYAITARTHTATIHVGPRWAHSNIPLTVCLCVHEHGEIKSEIQPTLNVIISNIRWNVEDGDDGGDGEQQEENDGSDGTNIYSL